MVQMNVLLAMRNEAKRLGFRPGESADDWVKRDPKSAAEYSCWLAANTPAIVKAIASVIR